eukprot:scaffold17797_cov68-Phaeocystis_antarctica.AAC.5
MPGARLHRLPACASTVVQCTVHVHALAGVMACRNTPWSVEADRHVWMALGACPPSVRSETDR